MTSPTTKPDDDAPVEDQPATRRAGTRPAGQVGGHTVQDWEQTSTAPRPRMAPGPRSAIEPQESAAGILEGVRVDEPAPETTPIVLRRAGRSPAAPIAKQQRPTFDARTHTLAAQSSALVDAITRELGEAIAVALRPAVASSIDRLVPMILSFGNVPDPVAATPPVEDASQQGAESASTANAGQTTDVPSTASAG